jgi:hypothetical protein
MKRTKAHQPTIDRTTTPPKGEMDTGRFDAYIGIDNGVTGTIGIIDGKDTLFYKTPVKLEQDFTKKKGNISRVIGKELKKILSPFSDKKCMIQIERPMLNGTRFHASISGARCLEATLVIMEDLGMAYEYVDSKEWQKDLLPKGSKGEQLKVDSKNIGCRLFPEHRVLIEKHKDADGILIAEHCRRKFR